MADFHDQLRDVASQLFEQFKQGVVQYVALTPQAGATPDEPGEPVETSTTVNATVRAVSTKYVDGTSVLQTDKEISLPNDGIYPDPKGFFLVDGIRHKIIEKMNRPAAGTPVSFTCIVRANVG